MSKSEDLAERSLLARARAGDPQARQALVQTHAPLVGRFARTMCPRPEDAEDVAQEALLAALRALDEGRVEHIDAWLYVVVRSFCGKTRRRRKGEPETFEPVEERPPADTAPSPEARLQQAEETHRVQQAVRRLAPDRRAVLVLRDMEGLPTARVAAILGLSPAAVKSRLHRARKDLAALLPGSVASR